MNHSQESIPIAVGLNPQHPWIKGQEYEDCQILGPAVLVIVDHVDLSGNTLDGNLEALLWPLHDRKVVIGAIGVQRCSFKRCVFVGVGFAGDDEFLRRLRRDLTITTTQADRAELPWWQRIPWGKR